ncbi:heterokaryon incompatibility protein 6,OR allele [Podospora fimiseda]|uniref:Heterokaryon incompatibility protein 6,OR allele n=1 Tax=Podospora fimiseda TaxID=252190 RepID=A0AAN7H5D1_9PEZI|nr:heterokaryon incompatibility protein 6,OR allele [Podospora fimiseda]
MSESESEAPVLPPRRGPRGYEYTQLPPFTIRILNISGGSGNDPLICSLEPFPIEQVPSYEALSYCWGDQTEKHEILLDGFKFDVATNLHSALLRLRLHDKPRLLWVDAICINQNDVQERNVQVSFMRRVYQRAKCVLIWLGGPIIVKGEELWSIPPLIEAADLNLTRNDLPIRHGTKGWIRNVIIAEFLVGGDDLEDKQWNAVIQALIFLLQRPWFLRTWIIQEAALAKNATVVCGSHFVDWETFCRAVSYAIDLDYFAMTSPEIYSAIRNIYRARQQISSGQFIKPLDLLASFRIFQATDPRDKIFGILGLLNPSDLQKMHFKQPNYSMSLPDVYTQLAIDCLTLENNLDILSMAGESSFDSLPSWVPDWTFHQDGLKPLHPRFLSTLSFGNYRQLSPQSASCDTPLTFSISSDKKSLVLSGYIFDTITQVSQVLLRDYVHSDEHHPILHSQSEIFSSDDTFYFDPEVEAAIAVSQEWEEMCNTTVTSEPPQEVFFRTVHANNYPGGNITLTRQIFDIWHQPFRDAARLVALYREGLALAEERSSQGRRKLMTKGAKWLGKYVPEFGRFMKSWVKNVWPTTMQHKPTMLGLHRVMIKTEKGYVGLTGKGVEVGDKVGLFKGGRMPIVLRETEGKWRVVGGGDVYLHGVMAGEGWDEGLCGEMEIV